MGTEYKHPLKYIEYGAYGDLTVVVSNSRFYLIKGVPLYSRGGCTGTLVGIFSSSPLSTNEAGVDHGNLEAQTLSLCALHELPRKRPA